MFAWERREPKFFPKICLRQPGRWPRTKAYITPFLVVGLIWALIIQGPEWSSNIASFFLRCILVARLDGAATASNRILYVHSVSAGIAILLLLSWRLKCGPQQPSGYATFSSPDHGPKILSHNPAQRSADRRAPIAKSLASALRSLR